MAGLKELLADLSLARGVAAGLIDGYRSMQALGLPADAKGEVQVIVSAADRRLALLDAAIAAASKLRDDGYPAPVQAVLSDASRKQIEQRLAAMKATLP